MVGVSLVISRVRIDFQKRATFKGAVAYREYLFFLNQHNFFITTGMTLFFIYLRTELNYLSNDIILCGFGLHVI